MAIRFDLVAVAKALGELQIEVKLQLGALGAVSNSSDALRYELQQLEAQLAIITRHFPMDAEENAYQPRGRKKTNHSKQKQVYLLLDDDSDDDQDESNNHRTLADDQEHFYQLSLAYLLVDYTTDKFDKHLQNHPRYVSAQSVLKKWLGKIRREIFSPALIEDMRQFSNEPQQEILLEAHLNNERLSDNLRTVVQQLVADIKSMHDALAVLQNAPQTCNPSLDQRLQFSLEEHIPNIKYYFVKYGYELLRPYLPEQQLQPHTQNGDARTHQFDSDDDDDEYPDGYQSYTTVSNTSARRQDEQNYRDAAEELIHRLGIHRNGQSSFSLPNSPAKSEMESIDLEEDSNEAILGLAASDLEDSGNSADSGQAKQQAHRQRVIITVMFDMMHYVIRHERAKTYSEGEAYLLEHPERRGTFTGLLASGVLLLAQVDPARPAYRKKRTFWKNTATTVEKNLEAIVRARKRDLFQIFEQISPAEIQADIQSRRHV